MELRTNVASLALVVIAAVATVIVWKDRRRLKSIRVGFLGIEFYESAARELEAGGGDGPRTTVDIGGSRTTSPPPTRPDRTTRGGEMTEAALAKHIADQIGPSRTHEVDTFLRLLREHLVSTEDAAALEALEELAGGSAERAARNRVVRTLLRVATDDGQIAAAMSAFDVPTGDQPSSAAPDMSLRSAGLLTTAQLDDLERRAITTIPDLIAVIDASLGPTARALHLTIDRTIALRAALWDRLPSSVRATLDSVDTRPLVTGLLVQDD